MAGKENIFFSEKQISTHKMARKNPKPYMVLGANNGVSSNKYNPKIEIINKNKKKEVKKNEKILFIFEKMIVFM